MFSTITSSSASVATLIFLVRVTETGSTDLARVDRDDLVVDRRRQDRPQ
jgi:hypothetical protein